MSQLYPLKFLPIQQEKIWGGTQLHDKLGKPKGQNPIGESWEISAVKGHVSVVSNGCLKGKNLQEIIDEYPKELLGQEIFDKYGKTFPLLIKFIDARQDLSVQLHPNDALAKERHNSLGKEELWYILEAEDASKLYLGFNEEIDADSLLQMIDQKTLVQVLHQQQVNAGDVYHVKPGLVHSIGAGIVLAEIQQSSDITYRLYDWNREDNEGKPRELHIDLAMDAIQYDRYQPSDINGTIDNSGCKTLVKSNYFETNEIHATEFLSLENSAETFSIYINLGGQVSIETSNNQPVTFEYGETVLLPAGIQSFTLHPIDGKLKILQVFPK